LLREIEKANLTKIPENSTYLDHALIPDRFYIPTRYPNGLPDLSPNEAYSAADARISIDYAREILDFIQRVIQVRELS